VVEQAARAPSLRGRVRELLRNSLLPFSDPDPVPTMQIGLRFAAANLPDLRALVGQPNGSSGRLTPRAEPPQRYASKATP